MTKIANNIDLSGLGEPMPGVMTNDLKASLSCLKSIYSRIEGHFIIVPISLYSELYKTKKRRQSVKLFINSGFIFITK